MRGGCVISAHFLSFVEAGEIRGSSFRSQCHYSLDPSTTLYTDMLLHNLAFIIFAASIVYGETLNENSTESYKPEDLLAAIFNLNTTIQSRARNRFEFDDDYDIGDSAFIKPNNKFVQNNNFNIDDNDPQYYNQYNNDNRLKFTPDINPTAGRLQKKRKQRVHRPQGFGLEYQGPYAPSYPQLSATVPSNYGLWYPGSAHRPPNRSRPSLASAALSSVTEALTSIALYDDGGCVARLLCEAATGTSDMLQPVAGLEPLLTLLSTYGGVSSNPLFVFGRAVFLGMSSKKNPASCRYAYPQCPTDPEQLVYYLNNHNGGFFRFFNAPNRGQQSLNQFYDQLSQNYGINQQSSGQYIDVTHQQNQIPDYNLQNYGIKFPYQQNKYGLLNNIKFKNNYDLDEEYKIEKRIQNRPEKYLDYDDDLNFDNAYQHNTRWSFPEREDYIKVDNFRTGKGLKFPENPYLVGEKLTEGKRDPRGFTFPGENNKKYLNNNYDQENNPTANIYYNYNNINSDLHKGYNDNHIGYNKDQSIQTVYVVRGNGDPNHPEIIRLRPGQSIH